MGDDNRLVTIAVCLLVILPGLVLYSIGHTIRTVEYIVPSTYGMGLLTLEGRGLQLAIKEN